MMSPRLSLQKKERGTAWFWKMSPLMFVTFGFGMKVKVLTRTQKSKPE